MTNVYLKVNKDFFFYINTTIQKRLGSAGNNELCYRHRHQIYLEISLMYQLCCTSRENIIKCREISVICLWWQKEKPAGSRNPLYQFLLTNYKVSKFLLLLLCEEIILRCQHILNSPNVWKSSVILSFGQCKVTHLPSSLKPGYLSETLFIIHLDKELFLAVRFTLRHLHSL